METKVLILKMNPQLLLLNMSIMHKFRLLGSRTLRYSHLFYYRYQIIHQKQSKLITLTNCKY